MSAVVKEGLLCEKHNCEKANECLLYLSKWKDRLIVENPSPEKCGHFIKK